jgi:hypothetical protein
MYGVFLTNVPRVRLHHKLRRYWRPRYLPPTLRAHHGSHAPHAPLATRRRHLHHTSTPRGGSIKARAGCYCYIRTGVG